MAVSDDKRLVVRNIDPYRFFKAGFLENEFPCLGIPAIDIACIIKSAEIGQVFGYDAGLNGIFALIVPCRREIRSLVGCVCSGCLGDRADRRCRYRHLVFLVSRKGGQCQLKGIGSLAVIEQLT